MYSWHVRDQFGIEQHELDWFQSYHKGARRLSRHQKIAMGHSDKSWSRRLEDQSTWADHLNSFNKGHSSVLWKWLPIAHKYQVLMLFQIWALHRLHLKTRVLLRYFSWIQIRWSSSGLTPNRSLPTWNRSIWKSTSFLSSSNQSTTSVTWASSSWWIVDVSANWQIAIYLLFIPLHLQQRWKNANARYQVGLFYRIVSYEAENVSISSILCLTRDSPVPSIHCFIITWFNYDIAAQYKIT